MHVGSINSEAYDYRMNDYLSIYETERGVLSLQLFLGRGYASLRKDASIGTGHRSFLETWIAAG